MEPALPFDQIVQLRPAAVPEAFEEVCCVPPLGERLHRAGIRSAAGPAGRAGAAGSTRAALGAARPRRRQFRSSALWRPPVADHAARSRQAARSHAASPGRSRPSRRPSPSRPSRPAVPVRRSPSYRPWRPPSRSRRPFPRRRSRSFPPSPLPPVPVVPPVSCPPVPVDATGLTGPPASCVTFHRCRLRAGADGQSGQAGEDNASRRKRTRRGVVAHGEPFPNAPTPDHIWPPFPSRSCGNRR